MGPGPGAPSRAGSQPGWIQSRSFDLALFTLSPLAGLAVALAALSLPWGSRVAVAATFLVAIPHYMSSFSFFLGDDNLPYYRSRWIAFFAGPLAILAAVAVLRLTGNHAPVQITMFVWNIYHVARQSSGILSLYRRLNRGDRAERVPAELGILGVNAAMAFWYIDRFPPLYDALSMVHVLAPWSLRAVAVALGATSLAVLAIRLWRRERPVSVPEVTFLASSLLLFHPFLWVEDANLATLAMLMGHFIQYLAIVWLLNRRKYAMTRSGSWHQRFLSRASANTGAILTTIAGTGASFFVAERVTAALGVGLVYVVLWNAMTLIHFYVDGLVWAFKQPHVRRTVGAYLTPDERVIP